MVLLVIVIGAKNVNNIEPVNESNVSNLSELSEAEIIKRVLSDNINPYEGIDPNCVVDETYFIQGSCKVFLFPVKSNGCVSIETWDNSDYEELLIENDCTFTKRVWTEELKVELYG